MSNCEACAAAPAKKPNLVNVITVSTRIIEHLRASPRDMSTLKSRLANVGKPAAYRMIIAEQAPELAAGLYDAVAERISLALRSGPRPRIRQARRKVA